MAKSAGIGPLLWDIVLHSSERHKCLKNDELPQNSKSVWNWDKLIVLGSPHPYPLLFQGAEIGGLLCCWTSSCVGPMEIPAEEMRERKTCSGYLFSCLPYNTYQKSLFLARQPAYILSRLPSGQWVVTAWQLLALYYTNLLCGSTTPTLLK